MQQIKPENQDIRVWFQATLLPGIFLRVWRRVPGVNLILSKLYAHRVTSLKYWNTILTQHGPLKNCKHIMHHHS